MKVYIAGPFNARAEAIKAKALYEAAGIEVTSTWIESHLAEFPDIDDATARTEAETDLNDIRRADEFVLLNYKGLPESVGRHIEYGYALALQKPITIIGDRTHIFHHLAQVKVIAKPSVTVGASSDPKPVRA